MTSPDGLNLLEPDVITGEEIARFRRYYDEVKGDQNQSYEFWLEFGPDVLKRHKARTISYTLGSPSPVGALAALHQYVVDAFDDGIRYEIELAKTKGASRSDVLDTISIAFIHGGHPGMYAVSRVADVLRTYEDPEATAWPPEWSFDRDAFASGADFSSLEATKDDVEAILSWYRRRCGEVPDGVRFLAAHRPQLLKSYRSRYEHAIRESLPAQMLPYLLLHYHTARGSQEGIRENVLLGRALGMTRTQLLDAICSAVLHGGVEILGLVERAAGDLLDESKKGEMGA